jgi:Flp pilus assembly protein TadG
VLMFTLALVPLMGMLGLVVDIGWAYYRRESAQTAADAAAGAAAMAAYNSAGGSAPSCGTTGVSCSATEYICPSTLTTATNNIEVGCLYAKDNGFVTSGRQKVTVQSGVGNPPSGSASTDYWVVVRVSERVPQLFSRVLGVTDANITARATTGTKTASSGGCVIVMNPTASGAISMNGTTNLTTGCGVFDNSNSASAINIVGGGTITTTGTAKTYIVGNWNGSGTITPAPVLGASVLSDPFADMVPPAYSGCDDGGAGINLGSHANRNINPSGSTPYVICGGINLNAQSSVSLGPGTYVVKNGISLGAQTSLAGTGVTIYIESGSVNMAGGASVSLSAPTTGYYQGILFYQDRADTNDATLVGGTSQQMNGVLYFPSAHLNYTGGSSTQATQTTILSDTLTLVGNSNIAAAANTQFTGVSGGMLMIE